MKINKTNILKTVFAGIIFLISLFPVAGFAQTDSITISYENQFQQNLNELNDLYCWGDDNFYQGTFRLQDVNDIESEFEKLNLNVFGKLDDQTKDFYRFLENQSVKNQQNLIRYFSFYNEYFEVILAESGLPLELKYMAPALSAMNPNSVGRNGKSGIWQLSHFQGVLNGLNINTLVDERFNEQSSTLAMAKQLKKNISVFNDTEIAVWAYLFGNTKIQNAIYRSKDDNSLDALLKYLPQEASVFINAFQAMTVFLSSNRFVESREPFTERIEPDTVNIYRQMHFIQVTKVLGVSEKELKFLNPQYKHAIVPENKVSAQLVVPEGKWDDFVLWQDSINNAYDSTYFQLVTQKIEYPPAPNRQYAREPVKDLDIEGKTKIQYRIKTGDVLGIIAEKYDVRVADLKYWNNIYNERKIQAGKKIDIFVDEDKADYYLSLASVPKKKTESKSVVTEIQKASSLKVFEDLNAAKKVEHVVKSGESPFVIAKKYEGVTPDEILEWNNIDDARKIQIGQKLIVYLKE